MAVAKRAAGAMGVTGILARRLKRNEIAIDPQRIAQHIVFAVTAFKEHAFRRPAF